MDLPEILAELSHVDRLPVEAIQAARRERTAITPIFLDLIERQITSPLGQPDKNRLFFIFHLLGEWQATAAYRPLARLLRSSPEEIELIFDGAVTETTHQVMAAVFDGDPTPLYDIINDQAVDEFIRSRMLEALAMVTLDGRLPGSEAARFLRACHATLLPSGAGCFVWNGWQSAIALLGLTELVPLVEQAFKDRLIDPSWMDYHHFEEDLRRTLDDSTAWQTWSHGEFALFGDTIEELSTWACFQPSTEVSETNSDGPEEFEETGARSIWPSFTSGPAINQYKQIGRNDPCPCGSGKKFKKCCLSTLGGSSLRPAA
ncbi:MAG: DUF1186 domain-containing protein [Hyphomicrobiales bacterium]|nr:DUF1186 domain-containing protein [Hyphomicrobiales bacterium]